MASLPSQSSWRLSSRSEHSSLEATEIPTASLSQPESSSQSSVLNDSQPTGFPGSSASQDVAIPMTTTKNEGLPVRICWICQQESNDDLPGTEWRTPCPCSLTAHNECLLEWITSEEAPKPGEIGTNKKIKCPQCQAIIRIERPRDYIVLAASKLQAVAKGLVLPTAFSAIVGCFYSGLLVYGVNTIHVVFGSEEALEMTMVDNDLSFLTRHVKQAQMLINKVLESTDPFLPTIPDMPNWRLYLGLPMIAPTLILARTRIADQVFAVLPLFYFLFRRMGEHSITQWPPSKALTFATLPYLRSAYNELYKHTFTDLEKKWDLAVQRKPREGETQEQVEQEQNRADNDALFDLEVELRNGLADDDGQWEDVPGAANEAQPPAQAGEQPAVEGGIPPNGEEVRADGAPAARHRRENRRNWSTSQIGMSVMGALFFPKISAGMGDILQYTLPTKWVGYKGKGLLHEKWGRTVVGGCLFVVLKDAIVLYCKWKKARDFGKKRVLDYVGKRRDDVVPVLGGSKKDMEPLGQMPVVAASDGGV